MKIELKQIAIRDLCGFDATLPLSQRAAGYKDLGDDGITGYSGRLNIRPAFQREFVYGSEQRNKVVETVLQGFPLNVMYWVINKPSAPDLEAGAPEFELLDGQQRTISICTYVAGLFSVNGHTFHGLAADVQQKILDYELMIYFCEGNDSEKLDWFKTINIAGEKLTEQELRNAIYTGPWLTAAKKQFSKTGCPAYVIASDYLQGAPIQQDYLATALKWISQDKITDYMAANQVAPNANELWLYFNSVIAWVKATFPNYRREMKGVDWGLFYNDYKTTVLDATDLEKRTSALMSDEDVTRKKGIYAYLLTGSERHLSIRTFNDKAKREAYERQDGKCAIDTCGKACDIAEMEADHINPWSKGGKTIASNCQMLCKACNRAKGGV